LGSKKQVILHRHSSIPIIEILGDVSNSVKEDLITIYEKACQSHPQNIIIKFDENGHIYSSGISVLVGLIAEAEKNGRKIHATGLSEHFVHVFTLTSLTKFIQIFPSEQEALAALK
jgi:anti-anti-sigma factor